MTARDAGTWDDGTPADLGDDGLLWILNAAALHPRGYALAVDTESGELRLIGDGSEVWVFAEETAEIGWAKLEALLKRRRSDLAMPRPAEVEPS